MAGRTQDSGQVRLSDFIMQLESFKAALKHTERIAFKKVPAAVYYRIVDLSYRSPATIVLEAFPVDPSKAPGAAAQVIDRFLESIAFIRRRGEIPEGFDLPALEAFRDLGATLEKNVSNIVIENGKDKIPIDREYQDRIASAIGPDELIEGSIAGMLEKVNLHNTARFEIFPTIGPVKVVCDFPQALKEKVKAGLERYVRVYGRLRLKQWDRYAHTIDAADIEIYPPEEQLPTLWELRGIAPGATGDLSTEDFIRRIRDAW